MSPFYFARGLTKRSFALTCAQGGFSSVFKAYDLHTHEYAACKLHRMSESWAEVRN